MCLVRKGKMLTKADISRRATELDETSQEYFGILNDNKFIKLRDLSNPEPMVPTIDLFLNYNSIL